MMRLAMVWAAAVLVAAGALSAGLVPDVGRVPEAWHVIGHLVLFGVLALLLKGLRPWVALAAVLLAGAGVEVVQAAAHGVPLGREAAYDMLVDALAGMAGVGLASGAPAATALGVWLHPAFVIPLGLFGTFYAATREPSLAAIWAGAMMACLLPVGAFWALGVRRGRYADADLADRAQRPGLFAVGCASVAAFAAVAFAAHAPGPVISVAIGALIGACAVTALTVAGFKVSGHVATPLLLAVAIAPFSWRGPPLFVAAGALLTWARVRAGVHRPSEVAGAWALAAAAGLIVFR
ncbi:MAG: hypothetical protein MUF34_11165 [Polyangiaceae bacterium]|nr:hypothetical protein [Polyangiaceae bacterium]